MRYYEHEHFDAYARIRREGLDQWSDLHTSGPGRGYDDFSNRSFLARMLPADEEHLSTVLEYGCGTVERRVSSRSAATGCTLSILFPMPSRLPATRGRARVVGPIRGRRHLQVGRARATV